MYMAWPVGLLSQQSLPPSALASQPYGWAGVVSYDKPPAPAYPAQVLFRWVLPRVAVACATVTHAVAVTHAELASEHNSKIL